MNEKLLSDKQLFSVNKERSSIKNGIAIAQIILLQAIIFNCISDLV